MKDYEESSASNYNKAINMPKHTEATVTPAVRQVFEMVFGDQMTKENDEDLENNNSVEVVEEVEEEADDNEDVEELPPKLFKRTPSMNKHTDSQWIGNGVSDGRRRRLYYSSVVLDGNLTVTIGDTVLIQPTDPSVPLYVAQVVNMFDGADGARAHVRWFGRGLDTVLGAAGDPTELFLLTECEDRPLLSIWRKCSVTFVPPQDQDTWRLEGGTRVGRRSGHIRSNAKQHTQLQC